MLVLSTTQVAIQRVTLAQVAMLIVTTTQVAMLVLSITHVAIQTVTMAQVAKLIVTMAQIAMLRPVYTLRYIVAISRRCDWTNLLLRQIEERSTVYTLR